MIWKVIMVQQWQYFKLRRIVKNEFNNNQNVFKNICFTKGHIIPELTPGFQCFSNNLNMNTTDKEESARSYI